MIEIVTPANLAHFLLIAQRFHEESVYRDLPFNGQKMSSLIGNPIIYAAVAKRAEGYVGMMMGIVAPDFFSDVPIATDFGVYIAPEARGKGFEAIELVRDFERWAREKGAAEIRPAVTAGIDDERAVKFYGKLGYERLGTIFKKRI